MSSFTTELVISPIEGETGLFYLQEHFRYRIGSKNSKKIIEVPKGYITDAASIPRVLQPILSPWGKYGKSAILHDFCYRNNPLGTKEASDKLMVEAMEVLGVPSIQIKTIYYGLKIGGGIVWDKYRKQDPFRIYRERLVGYNYLPINRERNNK